MVSKKKSWFESASQILFFLWPRWVVRKALRSLMPDTGPEMQRGATISARSCKADLEVGFCPPSPQAVPSLRTFCRIKKPREQNLNSYQVTALDTRAFSVSEFIPAAVQGKFCSRGSETPVLPADKIKFDSVSCDFAFYRRVLLNFHFCNPSTPHLHTGHLPPARRYSWQWASKMKYLTLVSFFSSVSKKQVTT